MKKIFLTLMLFFIGMTTLPKQGRSAPACYIIGTYQPNSRVWDVTIGTDSTALLCNSIFGIGTVCFASESSCSSGYKKQGYFTTTYGAYYADTNCSSFDPSGSVECAACSSGFTLTLSGHDSLFNTNCCLNLTGETSGGGGLCNVQASHACSPSNCGSGKYRKSTSSSCTCSTCPTNGTCTGDGVFTCSGGYYKASTTATSCTACPTGCSECSSSSSCSSCSSGYYLNGSTCTKCSTGVATCTSASVHTSCDTGYFLSGNTCTGCLDNASCPGGTDTFYCVTDYEKNSDATGCFYSSTIYGGSCPTGMSLTADKCCCEVD